MLLGASRIVHGDGCVLVGKQLDRDRTAVVVHSEAFTRDVRDVSTLFVADDNGKDNELTSSRCEKSAPAPQRAR